MTLDELMKEILEILPMASFEEDNYGQIIIYTNLILDERKLAKAREANLTED